MIQGRYVNHAVIATTQNDECLQDFCLSPYIDGGGNLNYRVSIHPPLYGSMDFFDKFCAVKLALK